MTPTGYIAQMQHRKIVKDLKEAIDLLKEKVNQEHLNWVEANNKFAETREEANRADQLYDEALQRYELEHSRVINYEIELAELKRRLDVTNRFLAESITTIIDLNADLIKYKPEDTKSEGVKWPKQASIRKNSK